MNLTIRLILVSIFVTIVASDEEWNVFKKIYQKSYTNAKEEAYRKQVFYQNLQIIEDHNRKYDEGLVSYSVRVNHLADRTHREMFPPTTNKNYKLNSKPKTNKLHKKSLAEVPESIDWRDYGVVTPVANQESCNSCWAFAIVGTIEAHVGIYENRTVSLSQQNLDDCVYSNFSCAEEMRRTVLEDSYQYIVDNGGLDTLDSYPYENYIVGACRYNSSNSGATIKDYVEINEGDEEEMKVAVGTIGPVTVAITTDFTWSIYMGGVYYKENCVESSSEPFNHAVVVVGYGSDNGTDYWLVKNSWASWFGQEGYIKMARNRENNCGIASYARYPVLNSS